MSEKILEIPPGPSLVKIEEQTPSGTGTLTFSSLGAYTHLKLVWVARSTDTGANNVGMSLRFNADTGSTYDQQRVQGQASTATVSENIASSSITLANITAAGGSSTANSASSGEASISDYRGTTFEKNVVSLSANKRLNATGGLVAQHWVGSWRNAAAVTSITILLSAGNFVAGSKFSLYGMS